jgi:hypothetical protein
LNIKRKSDHAFEIFFLLEFEVPSSNLPPTFATMESISSKMKVQIVHVKGAKCTQSTKNCVDISLQVQQFVKIWVLTAFVLINL